MRERTRAPRRVLVLAGLMCLLVLVLAAGCRTQPADALPAPLPPTLEPTPCSARLEVRPDPAAASVTLDGLAHGQAPTQMTVPPGRHRIDLSAAGYASYRLFVDVACGELVVASPTLYDTTAPQLTMDPLPQSIAAEAGLKVAAAAVDNRRVASLQLYLDGRLLYSLDGDRLRHNLDTRALEAGPHTLTIVATDLNGNTTNVYHSFGITVAAGADTALMTLPATTPTAGAAEATPAAQPLPPEPVPTSAPTATPEPTPLPAVAAYEDQITLMMYDYEPALYTDPSAGHSYPLLNHDQVGAPVSRVFRTIVLQNEYLQVVILPELGGRVYQMRFLPTQQPLLYNSRIAKPTHWGPADQGWWLALGGIEFAFPVEEHGYLSAQPWDAGIVRQQDGSATAVLQIRETTTSLEARIEVTLMPGEAGIRQHTSITNRSGATQQFQFWTNAQLAPGRHGVGSELQITFPADSVVVHSTGDSSLPPAGSTLTWPVFAGRDLSSYGEWRNWLGFFGVERWAPFVAVYDRATQIGLVHAASTALLRGSKVFGFGRDFDNSAFSDDGAQYLEVWSGISPTFWDRVSLAPERTLSWIESWYVVSQSGGVTVANEKASLYAWRVGDLVRVTVAAPAEHRWRLIAEQGGTMLSDQVFDVRPDTPYRTAVTPVTDGAPIEWQIVDLAGTPVLDTGG